MANISALGRHHKEKKKEKASWLSIESFFGITRFSEVFLAAAVMRFLFSLRGQ